MTALWVAAIGGDLFGFAATVVSVAGAAVAAIVGARQNKSARRTDVEIAAINAAVERQRADQAAAVGLRSADLEQVQQLRDWYQRLAADHRAEIDRLREESACLRADQAAQRARIAKLEATVRELEARIAVLEGALAGAGLPVPP